MMNDDTKNTLQEPRVEDSNGEQVGSFGDDGINHKVPLDRPEKKRRRTTPTRRQIAANRANAKKSTGPRTLEGKEIVARNAIRHGLTSRSPLLPGDDPKEYELFAEGLEMCWAPQTEQEVEL